MEKLLVALPAYNEGEILEANAEKLLAYLSRTYPGAYRLVIVDNGSTDDTLRKAQALAEKTGSVDCIHLDGKGKGGAVRAAWSLPGSEILAYMDIDLSTGLDAFPKLIDALEKEGFDIAIGSRFLDESKVRRSLHRWLLSKGYGMIIHLLFGTGFSDAPCGFKAMKKDAAENLLPEVRDNGWFFDTELLIRAEREGYKIKEVPVTWVESGSTKVKILGTVYSYLASILRMRLS